MIKKIFSWVKSYKWRFAAAIMLSVATLIAGIGLMSSSGYLISRAAQRPMLVDLFMVTAAVRFFGISRAVVRYFERITTHDLTFRILLTVRTQVYKKIDALSLGWMLNKRPGELLSNIITDIEALQNVYLRILSPSIVAFVISLLTTFLISFISPILAAMTLLFLVLSGIVLSLLGAYYGKDRGSIDVRIQSDQKVFLVDNLQGMQDLLWMGQERRAEREFNEMQSKIDNLQLKHAGMSGMLEGLNSVISHSAAFVVLVMAIPMILAGDIPGVMLAMLVLGVLSSFEAVQGLGNAFLNYDAYKESGNRLCAILQEHEPSLADKGLAPVSVWPEIAFKNVSFSYPGSHGTVSDISLDIPYGSKTAIVGPVGSGKSTLIHLLLGFWPIEKGHIYVGNSDIMHLEGARLRSLFAVGAQDAYVFNRSLRENLLLADPAASDDQLIRVLKKTGLEGFTNSLDLNLDSQGMRLSGGQRQLLFLSRVLLKDASVWIFDEPTAHLDVQTERKVLDTIWSNLGERSCMLITHRLVDMDKMDQIIVMHQGRVVERGTHAELISKAGFYSRMVHHQQQVLR